LTKTNLNFSIVTIKKKTNHTVNTFTS